MAICSEGRLVFVTAADEKKVSEGCRAERDSRCIGRWGKEEERRTGG